MDNRTFWDYALMVFAILLSIHFLILLREFTWERLGEFLIGLVLFAGALYFKEHDDSI